MFNFFTVFILSVELSTRSKLEDKLSKMNELLFLQDEVEMKSEDSNPVVKQLIDKETFVSSSSHKLEGLKPTTLTACIINALITIGACFYVLALMQMCRAHE